MIDNWAFENLSELKKRYRETPVAFSDAQELDKWTAIDDFKKDVVFQFISANIESFNEMMHKMIDDRLAEIISDAKDEIKKMQEIVRGMEDMK